jgi:hypothetical protein
MGRSVTTPAAASTAPSARWAALALWPRLIHFKGTPLHEAAVQASNRFFTFRVNGHFNESKAAWLSTVSISHDFSFIDLPVYLELRSQFRLRAAGV